MSGVIKLVDILGVDVTHRQTTPLHADTVMKFICTVCGATGWATTNPAMPPVLAYCDHGSKPKAAPLDDVGNDSGDAEENEVRK